MSLESTTKCTLKDPDFSTSLDGMAFTFLLSDPFGLEDISLGDTSRSTPGDTSLCRSTRSTRGTLPLRYQTSLVHINNICSYILSST